MRTFQTSNGKLWQEIPITEWDKLNESEREILYLKEEGIVFVRRIA